MPMWREIVTTAVVGTERGKWVPPIASGPVGEHLVELGARDPEEALLGAAGLVSLYRIAGLQLRTDEQPSVSICEPDVLVCCSAEAGQHLEWMLGGSVKEALPDWLNAVYKSGQLVPYKYLPRLLERGCGDRSLRTPITQVIGNRGRWLALQNESWKWGSGRNDDAEWETGTLEERLYLLTRLRETTPVRARSLLESTWKTEGAKDRLKFLDTFAAGLNPGDEQFLTVALTDRSIEVRRLALSLLLRLPSSELRRRFVNSVGQLITYRKPLLGKARLDVNLPADMDEWHKENIPEFEPEPHLNASAIVGEKGWRLMKLVGAMPVSEWNAKFDRKPDDLIEAAFHSEWKTALLAGFISSAKINRDNDWIEAILRQYQLSPDKFEAAIGNPFELASQLPSQRIEKLIEQALSHNKVQFDSTNPAFQLLINHRSCWSSDLSKVVLNRLKRRVGESGTNMPVVWQTRSALKQFALYIAPEVSSEVIDGWPVESEKWGEWQTAIDEFQTAVQFRADMLRAINKTEKVPL
jgi:hypothetical protein